MIVLIIFLKCKKKKPSECKYLSNIYMLHYAFESTYEVSPLFR